MEVRQVIGFLGDISNLAGGILLAWDPIHRRKTYLKQGANNALPDEVTFEEHDGSPVQRGEALERIQVSGETKRSRWGYRLLIFGFTLLTVARSLEVFPCWPARVWHLL